MHRIHKTTNPLKYSSKEEKEKTQLRPPSKKSATFSNWLTHYSPDRLRGRTPPPYWFIRVFFRLGGWVAFLGRKRDDLFRGVGEKNAQFPARWDPPGTIRDKVNFSSKGSPAAKEHVINGRFAGRQTDYRSPVPRRYAMFQWGACVCRRKLSSPAARFRLVRMRRGIATWRS